jgi:imidazolonepropionase
MRLEILHYGSAIALDKARLPLRALLPLCELRGGALRIERAELHHDELELALSDGRARRLRAPLEPPPGELLIENAAQVLTLADDAGVGLLPRATVACRGGRIVAVAPAGAPLPFEPGPETVRVDARGGVVAPGLVDPHTHPVFAGDRALEFALRAEGQSYLQIHAAGGGILSTVRATRAASFEELAASCARNLDRLLRWGVTTCEAKSGYALDLGGELRLLEVLRAATACHPVEVVPTLLGAHALPPEHRERRSGYVALCAEEMVPHAAREGLARYCDAYCEQGAFSPAEVERIFAAARGAGLGLRLHAEQFSDQGGAALAARMGAASVDHLEAISADGIAALANAGTTAVLLPGAALACRCPWPPARALLDAGVAVALGTDLNPGSSMTAALPLMMSLACMQLGMSCDEAWRAVTVVAARSIGREDLGRIEPGCQADLVIFDAPDSRYVPYHYGENHARVVIKSGQLVLERST